jgi:hypothetical protein
MTPHYLTHHITLHYGATLHITTLHNISQEETENQ